MAKPVKLQVTVEHGHSLRAVARKLAAQGFTVGEILTEIDVITGSAPAGSLERLKKVEGVTDVARQPAIDIGGPGDRETW